MISPVPRLCHRPLIRRYLQRPRPLLLLRRHHQSNRYRFGLLYPHRLHPLLNQPANVYGLPSEQDP